MKSSNRLLLWFGVAIGTLIALSIIMVAVSSHQPKKVPPNTPQATVQNYLLALTDRDYPKAFGYLSPPPQENLTYSNWVSQLTSGRPTVDGSWKASLGAITVSGNQATVEIIMSVFSPGGPFSDPIRTNNVTFTLTKTGNTWLITSPTYVYWLY